MLFNAYKTSLFTATIKIEKSSLNKCTNPYHNWHFLSRAPVLLIAKHAVQNITLIKENQCKSQNAAKAPSLWLLINHTIINDHNLLYFKEVFVNYNSKNNLKPNVLVLNKNNC